MEELSFLLILFLSNVLQTITGFAGTVLAMPPSMLLLGMVLGIQLYVLLPSDILLRIYGMLVMAIGAKNLLVKRTFHLPRLLLLSSLLVAGIIHGMFVSGGALLVIYAVSILKDKHEFRATVAPIWVILNSYMMVVYLKDGLVNTRNLQLIGLSIIPLLLAIFLGNKLQARIQQQVFLTLTYVLLIISGISIIL